MSIGNSRRNWSRGQSYVEFAMIGTALFFFVFGIINMAQAVFAYNWVAYAAREGSRWAAVRGSDIVNSGTPMTTSSDVSSYVEGETRGLKLSNMNVAASWSDPTEKPGSTVLVNVTYQFNFTAPFQSLGPINMGSTSQMVISY
ncbi:MAG TPA: TadE/TadG family type IV pilus assembly protein [Candidatus Binataceae bacterium]|nr:TadE/TadG family type IV pilus assembly protein [Candidatus Binataceae bacterium]